MTLEPLLPDHAKILFDGLRDERVYAYTPNRRPATLAVLEKRFSRLRYRRAPDSDDLWLNWAVRLDDGTYVGWVQTAVSADRSAEIGYIIFAEHWRKGYAGRACGRMLEFLGFACGVIRAVAHVDAQNEPSIKLLERLGFVRVASGPALDMEGRLEHRYESAL